MTYRQLDTNGDFTFGSGLANYLQNSTDAVVQAVQTRFKLWEGEWFLDITEGTPYMSGMLGKYTQETIDQLIKKRILETQGVDSILYYQGIYNGNDRSYIVSATISTIYGTADITGVF
jgi:hypothetical protein